MLPQTHSCYQFMAMSLTCSTRQTSRRRHSYPAVFLMCGSTIVTIQYQNRRPPLFGPSSHSARPLHQPYLLNAIAVGKIYPDGRTGSEICRFFLFRSESSTCRPMVLYHLRRGCVGARHGGCCNCSCCTADCAFTSREQKPALKRQIAQLTAAPPLAVRLDHSCPAK